MRVLAEFGIRAVLLTNAAGGINRSLRPGDLMRITDHINLMGDTPLRGPLLDGKERFVDLTQPYDVELNRLLEKAGRRSGLRLRSGIYAGVPGPNYETPAECRAFAKLGADAVGMSTVPEVIVARQCGLAVAALSCITNLAACHAKRPLSHSEVLTVAQQSRDRAARLLGNFAQLYAKFAEDKTG
jgi:purine-nucleoside phosphorylase